MMYITITTHLKIPLLFSYIYIYLSFKYLGRKLCRPCSCFNFKYLSLKFKVIESVNLRIKCFCLISKIFIDKKTNQRTLITHIIYIPTFLWTRQDNTLFMSHLLFCKMYHLKSFLSLIHIGH